MYRMNFLFFIWIILFFATIPLKAQNYGLHFYSHETIQDKRTSLDLSPNSTLCLNSSFDLSFDIYFSEHYKDYYGYIFRIITDKGLNIDLIYDQKPTSLNNFKLIIGNRFSRITFKLDRKTLFNKWNRLRIKFNRKEDRLYFDVGKRQLTEGKIGISTSGCYKIIFGVNSYNKFKTSDLPSMNIRDIKINEEGKEVYSWPLKETDGLEADEEFQGKKARVKNPSWIRAAHKRWQLAKRFIVNGNLSTAFDTKAEVLYITGPKSLYRFDVGSNAVDKITYTTQNRSMPQGNQSVFNNFSGSLYNFYVDQKNASVFDFKGRRWIQGLSDQKKLTVYWQANKFISRIDSSLYVIGGYGQRKYKSTVQRYQLKTKQWDTLAVKGDRLMPRYLAGLGSTPDGSHAYIIGGYGSNTGEQMLNPENYYDLIRYDVRRRSFKKIYSLKKPVTDFTFASSLVINTIKKQYYGLAFQNNKFNSHLQLITGSLDKPEYQYIGNQIPYIFHDISSYADLYWSKKAKKLLAVTLHQNQNKLTEVKIYTISFPPEAFITAKPSISFINRMLFPFLVGILLISEIMLFIGKRQSKHVVVVEKGNKTGFTEAIIAGIAEETEPEEANKGKIFLFGNMQVYDSNGEKITSMFSPVIKELLLLIMLHCTKNGTGITSKKLDELLWFDKSKKDARNNRAVNTAKLRTILKKVGALSLTKEAGYWKMTINDKTIKIDYLDYLDIINKKQPLNRQEVISLLQLLNRGTLLLNTNYEWMDYFKTKTTQEVIEFLLEFTGSQQAKADPDLIIRITDTILQFDEVNEEAMIMKCNLLAHLRKHTMAKNAFEKFSREYSAIYDTDYVRTFHELIEHPDQG